MSNVLEPDERETTLSMTGDDHNQWLVTTDDLYWISRLRKLGIAPVDVKGSLFIYHLTSDQVLIRAGKRKVEMTEARKQALLKGRLRSKTPDVVQEIATQ